MAPGPFPTEGAASRLFVTQAGVERMLKGIPAGRVGDPKELANLAAFLVSDYADYINGKVVTMDGGASVNFPMFDWEKD
jgi:NAD(P)-dependent dehydrogenase (short-subunit alcohol dehydrogenase family)